MITKSPSEWLSHAKSIVADLSFQAAHDLYTDAIQSQVIPSAKDVGLENPTRVFDHSLEVKALRRLEALGVPMIVVTEESQIVAFHTTTPDATAPRVLLDPLNSSDLYRRRVTIASVEMAVISPEGKPIAAVVGDVFGKQLYYTCAEMDGAFVQPPFGPPRRLAPSAETSLSRSFVASYALKHYRARELSLKIANGGIDPLPSRLFTAAGGSLELCRVADGARWDYHAVIEWLGYYPWDLLPGAIILEKSGGMIRRLDGTPICFFVLPPQRQPFLAAGNETLYTKLQSWCEQSQVAIDRVA